MKERFKDNGCRIFLEDNSKFLWEFSRESIVDNKCCNVEEYTTMLQDALRKYKKEYCFNGKTVRNYEIDEDACEVLAEMVLQILSGVGKISMENDIITLISDDF